MELGVAPASSDEILAGGGSVKVNADGSISILPDSGAATVTFTGAMRAPAGTKAIPAYSFTDETDSGLYHKATFEIGLSIDDTLPMAFTKGSTRYAADQNIWWSNTNGDAGAPRVIILARESDGVLMQHRDSVHAQEYQLYGDRASAANYERLVMRTAAAGDYDVMAEAGGTGTLRGLNICGSGGTLCFFEGTPQARQAHIVDADGTLADITTKFNTLLADLEGYNLLASS